MTYAQKMMDEHRIGYMDGREEGLRTSVVALKGGLDSAVIAGHFKMSLEQVMDILGQE